MRVHNAGPVWTTIYTLCGLCSWLVWTHGGFEKQRAPLTLYGINMLFNLAWNPTFFFFHAMRLAFWDALGMFLPLCIGLWAKSLFIPNKDNLKIFIAFSFAPVCGVTAEHLSRYSIGQAVVLALDDSMPHAVQHAGDCLTSLCLCRHCRHTGPGHPGLLQGGAAGRPADAAIPGMGKLCSLSELHTDQYESPGVLYFLLTLPHRVMTGYHKYVLSLVLDIGKQVLCRFAVQWLREVMLWRRVCQAVRCWSCRNLHQGS